jgi:hypothetical protein
MTFGHAIVFKNVIANEDSISIVLETSKTDQFRNGVYITVQKQTDTDRKSTCLFVSEQ